MQLLLLLLMILTCTITLGGAMRDEPEETSLSGLAGGCCFDFSKHSEHLFVVGTEEGRVHKCRLVRHLH